MSALLALTYGGEPQERDMFDYGPQSDLCRALGCRYPGIRFNRLTVLLRTDEYIRRFPAEEDTPVFFSLSGPVEVLKAHGFDRPTYCASRARTKTGLRLAWAAYPEGLDRVTLLLMPEFLGRFQQPGKVQP